MRGSGPVVQFLGMPTPQKVALRAILYSNILRPTPAPLNNN